MLFIGGPFNGKMFAGQQCRMTDTIQIKVPDIYNCRECGDFIEGVHDVCQYNKKEVHGVKFMLYEGVSMHEAMLALTINYKPGK